MSLPWDSGITWKTDRVITDPSFLAVDVRFISDRVLRAFTSGTEDVLIEGYIAAAMDLYEEETGHSLWPQTITFTASGFPSGPFQLPFGPIRSVESISYYDDTHTAQDYGGSPPSWVFSSGGRYSTPTLEFGLNESWPTAGTRQDAVTVTYSAGYTDPDDVPALVKNGIAAVVGEMYKNPDLSNEAGQIANVLNLDRFWRKRY